MADVSKIRKFKDAGDYTRNFVVQSEIDKYLPGGRHFIDDAEINVEAAKREGMQGAWLDVRREGHLRDILARFL